MLSIIQSAMERLRPSRDTGKTPEATPKGKDDGRSIEKRFYEEMVAYFRDLVVKRSVGKRMVFHMGYVVWLEPSDYHVLRDELIVIVPEVIEAFYDVLRECQKDYPKCTPGSTEWTIQISPTDIVLPEGGKNDLDEIIKLEKGQFIISSTFHSLKLSQSNVQQQPNVTLSFRPVNSDLTKDLNVNRELLVGLEARADAFIQKFDYVKAGLTANPDQVYSIHGYGTLKYSDKEGDAIYTIRDKEFFVSGPSDERVQSNVLVLPDSGVVKEHLAFRYDDGKDCFYVSAVGETILNERPVMLSRPGELVWHKVSKHASFLLAGGVGLEFDQTTA